MSASCILTEACLTAFVCSSVFDICVEQKNDCFEVLLFHCGEKKLRGLDIHKYHIFYIFISLLIFFYLTPFLIDQKCVICKVLSDKE